MLPSRLAITTAFAVSALACGGGVSEGQLVSKQLLTPGDQLTSSNGMSTNGMSTNGMSTNGMSTNGMKGNGLALTGGASSSGISAGGLTNSVIGASAFRSWFQANASYSDMVMTYVVRCAVPAGQTRSYTNGNTTYTWQGALGLAPAWSSGAAISSLEQMLVSACLGAHTNRFGQHVNFSVVGFRADYSVLPLVAGEAAAYPIQEGAFFGNLFNGGPVYSCSMGTTDTAGVSGPRECAMSDMPTDVCAPLINTQQPCWSICQGYNLPGVGWSYLACTGPDKVLYAAVDTNLANSDIYWCGDGVCQFTESCYDSATKTGCLQDCGKCK